jgi:hypothetical protein
MEKVSRFFWQSIAVDLQLRAIKAGDAYSFRRRPRQTTQPAWRPCAPAHTAVAPEQLAELARWATMHECGHFRLTDMKELIREARSRHR